MEYQNWNIRLSGSNMQAHLGMDCCLKGHPSVSNCYDGMLTSKDTVLELFSTQPGLPSK